MTNAERIKEMEKDLETVVEALEEMICDACVWPFKETDQEKMAERCDNCPIKAALLEAVQQARGAGYARAIRDAMESVAAAHKTVFGGGKE